VHPFSSSSSEILFAILKLVYSSSTLPFVARVFHIEMFSYCLHSFSISFWMLSQSSFVMPSRVKDLKFRINLPFSNIFISSAQIEFSVDFFFSEHHSIFNFICFIIILKLYFLTIFRFSRLFLDSVSASKPNSILL